MNSHWVFPCTSAEVWPYIRDVRGWPAWWNGLEFSIFREEGAWFEQCWRSPSGYRINLRARISHESWNRFVHCQVQGDLEGEGWLRIENESAPCRLSFCWKVRSTLAWMKWCEPFAHPVFEHFHHRLMKNGERGLHRILQGAKARNLTKGSI